MDAIRCDRPTLQYCKKSTSGVDYALLIMMSFVLLLNIACSLDSVHTPSLNNVYRQTPAD